MIVMMNQVFKSRVGYLSAANRISRTLSTVILVDKTSTQTSKNETYYNKLLSKAAIARYLMIISHCTMTLVTEGGFIFELACADR